MSYIRNSESDLVYNSETDSYEPVAQEYVLTINPTPSDATVVLTATGFEQEGNSITVNSGTTVSYVISKTGYKTVSDEITVTEDQTLAISLVVDNIIHIQHLRGTTSQINNYTGKEGEITYDTTKKSLHVHDGTNAGGVLVDTVIAFQRPTLENNYTWYRLYASGWVEQGGIIEVGTVGNITITLPITMLNTDYTWNLSFGDYNGTSNLQWIQCVITNRTVNSFVVRRDNQVRKSWQVSGMAA